MDRADWRWVHRSLAAAALLVLACIVANLIPLDRYVLTSGQPRPVANLITAGRAEHGAGTILLSDVDATQISAFGYLFYGVFGHVPTVPGTTLLGPGIPPSELRLEEEGEAAQSVAGAKAAALRTLGFSVTSRGAGALVLAVEPGSPGSRHVRQGETVRAVDGIVTDDDCAFARVLARKRPGDQVELTVERSRVTSTGTIVGGPTVTEDVRLDRWPSSVPGAPAVPGCPGRLWTRRVGYLGLITDTEEAFAYPLPISVRATGLRGPSAGLAIALGIVDELSGGDLTGRRTVATIGTISSGGGVGDAPDVPGAAFAAWHAGATLFLVPDGQARAARLAVPSSLRVVGVRSLRQAIAALHGLGGKIGPVAPAPR